MDIKRYLTFIGTIYYPSGGMDDFKGDFDTLEEAINFIEKYVDNNKDYETVERQWRFTWANVWDMETRTKVWNK